MASTVIRKAWFSRPGTGVLATVPASYANASTQVTEAAWLASLAPWLTPGARTVNAVAGPTIGNVASSNPAGATTQAAGTPIAYVVRTS